MTGDGGCEAITGAWRRGRLSLQELWLRYVALGGDAAPLELEAFLLGLMRLDDYQHDILAHALNERLDELGLPRDVPYVAPWSPIPRPTEPGEQPESSPGPGS